MCEHLNNPDVRYGFDLNDDGTYDLNSCCGGCYSVKNVRFCPYCGTDLTKLPALEARVRRSD